MFPDNFLSVEDLQNRLNQQSEKEKRFAREYHMQCLKQTKMYYEEHELPQLSEKKTNEKKEECNNFQNFGRIGVE